MKQRILRAVVVLLILTGAGAELGIAIELIGMVDLLGVELFLSLIFGGALLGTRPVLARINRFFESLDPFFFIPDRRQVVACPGILVHAIPFLVSGCIAMYLVSDGVIPDSVV